MDQASDIQERNKSGKRNREKSSLTLHKFMQFKRDPWRQETIMMPLVKGKPGETENVCRESLKIILESQEREAL